MLFASSRVYFGSGNVVRWSDLPKIRKGLGKLRSARDERVSALVQDGGALWNCGSADCAKGSRGNSDELRIGHLREIAVVAQDREVSTSGDVFSMFLFFDLQRRDTNDMVVLQRELHSLFERDAPGRDQLRFLCEERRKPNQQKQNAKKRCASIHVLSPAWTRALPRGSRVHRSSEGISGVVRSEGGQQHTPRPRGGTRR